MFDKQPPNQRAKDASQRPSSQDQREILWPLPQRDDVGKDDLPHGDDSAAANSLHRPANEEDGEVLGHGGAEDCAEREEQDRHEQHFLAAKNIRQRGDEGLAHGTR